MHKRLFKGISLHSSIDNNDGRQETMTGAGTTHDTNKTLFQPLIPGETLDEPRNESNEYIGEYEPYVNDIEEYNLGQLADPKPFPSYVDDKSTKLLEECFQKDVVWSIANGLPGDIPLTGSWTAFSRDVSSRTQEKSLIE